MRKNVNAEIVTVNDIAPYYNARYGTYTNEATDTTRDAIENSLDQLVELGFIVEDPSGSFQLSTLGQTFSVILGLFYNQATIQGSTGFIHNAVGGEATRTPKVAARRKGWVSRNN